MKSKKLIFFGSGELGLDALIKLKSEFDVALVITKNRPPRHKGPMPVYDYCLENELEFITPQSKLELDSALSEFFEDGPEVELGLVVDYGIIISESSILKFSLGILNSHFSLLPSWRGADPITFPLLAGERKTGVTFMMIDKGMDTGQTIEQHRLTIAPDDDQLSLTAKLSDLSCSKLNLVVNNLFDHQAQLRPQPNKLITYSRMLDKSEAKFDFRKPASLLAREVKAFSTWPKLKLNLGGVDCSLKAATELSDADLDLTLGEIKFRGGRILIGCARGSALEILKLQPAGKNKMTAADFIRGYIDSKN